MASSIKKRLNLGFASAILLVLLVGAISIVTFRRQYQEGELVKHTYRVINQLGSIQSALVNMETGRRGFRSTNERNFLQPYYIGLQSIHTSLAQLQNLIKDNPTQIQKAANLNNLIESLLRFWSGLGQDASTYTRQKISEITSLEKNKMDSIRSVLTEMEKIENVLLRN